MMAGAAEEIDTDAKRLASDFVRFLETGEVPENLFAPDVFSDVTLPTWRLQAEDAEGLIGMRRESHPAPGRVPQQRLDVIPGGFVLEFTEAWEEGGTEWTSREMARADLRGGRIVAISIYCTGDWSPERVAEHARSVTLLKP